MDLALNADQVMVLDALAAMTKPFESMPADAAQFTLTSESLNEEIVESGFLDVAFDLGLVTAALVVERLARLPYALEAGISAIVGPALGDKAYRPICLIEEERWQKPVRFLARCGTLVVIGRDGVKSFTPTAAQVRVESEALFGYPMGTLQVDPANLDLRERDVDAEEIRTRWRIALAAEAAGLLAAALESVCTYTTERQQFGRPLATFQALRHRLAEAQVRTNGVYWLAMKAANTLDPADAALAAFHAQESARLVVYDFHQFLGGMGMTLEHPLHLWTYRLKLLIGELGGRGANALAAAEAIWG
jgi:hypothetical protein